MNDPVFPKRTLHVKVSSLTYTLNRTSFWVHNSTKNSQFVVRENWEGRKHSRCVTANVPWDGNTLSKYRLTSARDLTGLRTTVRILPPGRWLFICWGFRLSPFTKSFFSRRNVLVHYHRRRTMQKFDPGLRHERILLPARGWFDGVDPGRPWCWPSIFLDSCRRWGAELRTLYG